MKTTRHVVWCVTFFVFEFLFVSYMMFVYHPNILVSMFEPTSSTKHLTFVPYSKPTSDVVKEVIETADSCRWFSTFLLVVVPIRPWDIYARQLIRDTWFKEFKYSEDAALRFAVGFVGPDKQFELSEENGTFGDIVHVNSFENALTNKTLAVIQWANEHVNFSYLMKCDDDTYVFVENLIVELKKRPMTTKLYFGRMLVNNPPIRGKYKWADNDWNLGLIYLPFAMGGGYVLSHDLVAILSESSSSLKWHVNEDTAVGAWVSAFDHERRSDDRFCSVGKNKPLPKCGEPMLAYLFFAFPREEIYKQFYYLHEQVTSNASAVHLLTPPPPPPTTKPHNPNATNVTESPTKHHSNHSITATKKPKSSTKKPKASTDVKPNS